MEDKKPQEAPKPEVTPKKISKKLLIVLIAGGAALLLIIIAVIVILSLKGIQNTESINNPKKELADDSETALTTLTQKYITDNAVPTYDLYGEVGYIEDNRTWAQVQTQSDFSPNSTDCYPSYVKTCINLGREKVVMPNHSSVNISAGGYKKSISAEGVPQGFSVSLNAYAILPDESMVTLSGESRVQFNFYKNETRIIQIEGEAYYRVKPQKDGQIFTVQAGDRLIELNDTEMYINVSYNKADTNSQSSGLDSLSKSDPEEYKKKLEESKSNIYDVIVYLTSGSAKEYSRSDRNTLISQLTGDNAFAMFKYKDYAKRTAYEPSKDIFSTKKESTLTSTSLTDHLSFSMENYGIGNYSAVAMDDLIKMLQIKFDAVEIMAVNYAKWYIQDMADFLKQYNNLMAKISKCKDGWYKATSTICCPDGFVYDESRKTCTKTTYYYYCESGYTLGSDNMCHKPGSSSSSGPTPYYHPSNGDSNDCVGKDKPATYALCRAALDLGKSHMSGSKCCLDYQVAEPNMEPVN